MYGPDDADDLRADLVALRARVVEVLLVDGDVVEELVVELVARYWLALPLNGVR